MAKKLRRLQFTEIALCQEGANQLADIVIAKSKTPPQSLPSEETVFDLNTLPEQFRKAVSDELARVAAEAAESTKTPVVPEVPAPPVVPEVPVEVAKTINLQQAEIVELRKRLDAADEASYVTVTKSKLGDVADSEDIAKGLYALSKTNAPLVEKLVGALVSAQAIAKTGAAVLSREIGKSGQTPVTGSAYEKLEILAKSKVSSGVTKDFAKAFTEAMLENPQLYSEYDAERRTK
jgi:hypothetical protein